VISFIFINFHVLLFDAKKSQSGDGQKEWQRERENERQWGKKGEGVTTRLLAIFFQWAAFLPTHHFVWFASIRTQPINLWA